MEAESLIFKIYGNSPSVKIIDFLLSFPKNDFTQKEILEELGMSKTTFYKYFGNLLDTGIVTINRRIAKSKLYHINLSSPIVQNIKNSIDQLSAKLAGEQIDKIDKTQKKKTTNVQRSFSNGSKIIESKLLDELSTKSIGSAIQGIDWFIEKNNQFIMFEFKVFHNDKISIPTEIMKSYEKLHDRLNRISKCYFYVIGVDDIDFSKPDSSVCIFEMNQWKNSAIPHITTDIHNHDNVGDYIIYREYMDEISLNQLRELIDKQYNEIENKINDKFNKPNLIQKSENNIKNI